MADAVMVFGAGLIAGVWAWTIYSIARDHLEKGERKRMDEKLWPKTEVVCKDPAALKAELMSLGEKVNPEGMVYFSDTARLMTDSYLARVFEESGCSCKPLREKYEKLGQEIAKIDAKEHPVLDEIARLAKPFVKLWLRERLKDGTITRKHLESAAMSDARPITEMFVADIIAGWRPK